MTVYNKLVRDKQIELIREDDREAIYKVLTRETYLTELLKKVQEEAEEILRAETNENLIEEVGDLQEVLIALNCALGRTDGRIILASLQEELRSQAHDLLFASAAELPQKIDGISGLVDSLSIFLGHEDVADARLDKRHRKGGFFQGIFLVSAEDPR